jgi:hypothetical protein
VTEVSKRLNTATGSLEIRLVGMSKPSRRFACLLAIRVEDRNHFGSKDQSDLPDY